jgi:hypothetical protein
MKIRELLQTEIWSKRTSRKILVGFGVVIVGVFIWKGLDGYWITPPERNAARVALAEIDRLQNSSGMGDAEYDAGTREAKEKVSAVERAAWTSRDKLVAVSLLSYLTETDLLRSEQRPPNPTSPILDVVRIQTSYTLHRALD